MAIEMIKLMNVIVMTMKDIELGGRNRGKPPLVLHTGINHHNAQTLKHNREHHESRCRAYLA